MTRQKIKLKTPRYEYIRGIALNYLLEKANSSIPVLPEVLLAQENFSLQTYQTHSQLNDTDIREIAKAFGSKDAKSFYWADRNQGVVFYDDQKPFGRKKWTFAHELGHRVLGHYQDFDLSIKTSILEEDLRILEREADIFASHLLAPRSITLYFMMRYNIAVTDKLGIYTIIRCFLGLSAEASIHEANFISAGDVKRLSPKTLDFKILGKYKSSIDYLVESYPISFFDSVVNSKRVEHDKHLLALKHNTYLSQISINIG